MPLLLFAEEINYQKAIKEQKLAAEIAAAKRERDFYLSRVDKAKAVQSILSRKRKQPEQDQEAGDGDGGDAADEKHAKQAKEANPLEGMRILRAYGQRQEKPDPDEATVGVSSKLLRMVANKKE